MVDDANKKSDDYVIATNKQYSIKDFLKISFAEIGIINWQDYIKIDANFKRPVDVTSLCGNYDKAKIKLGWRPKTSFKELVKTMVKEDIKRHKKIGAKIKIIHNIKVKKILIFQMLQKELVHNLKSLIFYMKLYI